MIVAYRGNFIPNFSTETHIALSLEELGHEVVRIQEDVADWPETVKVCAGADLFLWTSTYGFATNWDNDEATRAVAHLNTLLPTAAVHLDKFFDLPRQDQLATVPWFRVDKVFTADGGNQDRFRALGINHYWMPAAVYGKEAVEGTPTPEYASDVAFVGSWRGQYHPEWKHRAMLIRFLRSTFRRQIQLWPKRDVIRGRALSDLYASVKVVVGDSCGVGGTGYYASDRIPETLGRGGFLLHPETLGIAPGLFTPGEHLDTFALYDWRGLRDTINRYLDDEELRDKIRFAGQAHVQAHHTYVVRMRQVLEVIAGVRDTVIDPVAVSLV